MEIFIPSPFNCFHKDGKGVVWFGQRLVIPQDLEIKKEILDEAHLSKFAISIPLVPRCTETLRKIFGGQTSKVK
jgi:hypothetical protein